MKYWIVQLFVLFEHFICLIFDIRQVNHTFLHSIPRSVSWPFAWSSREFSKSISLCSIQIIPTFEKHYAAPLNLSVIFRDRKQCDSLLMLHMIIYIGDIESYITYHLVNCTILFNCVKEYQQHSWNSLQLTNYAQGANHKGRFDDPGGGGVCRIRTIDCFSSAMLLFYPDVKGRVV